MLGSTLERVKLPEDVVARLEGKSSLGRLGLLIHSSLPASEPVLFLTADGLRQVPIGEIVRDRIAGSVVSFDPETFKVGYHAVTGWYEGPADRIYEVRLAYIPHINRALKTDYRSYYCDYTRSAVEEFYGEDIKTFGYKF